MNGQKKIAVVLFNLGGPESRESIRPFLYNFFSDPNIIGLPGPLRQILAARISARRANNEADRSYKKIGYCSPLLANTQAQAGALEEALNNGAREKHEEHEHCHEEYKTFICMRYWHPMAAQTAQEVCSWAPDKIILLPLYPQFSTATTGSSLPDWEDAAKKAGLSAPTAAICCYPAHDGFIDSSARNIQAVYERARKETGQTPRLLLSAHGLPEKTIRAGDPYQRQCEQSAQAIAQAVCERLNLAAGDLDWQICYQSRVGPLKWIGPSTEEALHKAAQDNLPVLIYPHAFVSEHVETLVEIEIEYRALAEQLGVPYFTRVPTAGTGKAFITGLKDMVRQKTGREGLSSGCEELCPAQFKKCPLQKRA